MIVNVLHVGIAYLNRISKKANSVRVEVIVPLRIIGHLPFVDSAHDMHSLCFLTRYNPSGVVNFFLVSEFKNKLLVRLLLERKVRHVESPCLLLSADVRTILTV